jgi:hypothetical protein
MPRPLGFLQRTASARALWRKGLCLLLVGGLLPGCTGVDRSLTYFGDKGEYDYVAEYEDRELHLQHSDIPSETLEQPLVAQEPHRLGDRSKDEIRDLSLAEALHLALQNNRIIRTRGDFRAGAQVYTAADNVPSIYDPAIRDSGVLFGGQGVEAALASFDPRFNTSLVWSNNNAYQNNSFLGGGVGDGSVLSQDAAQFQSQLTKTFAYGANLSLNQPDVPALPLGVPGESRAPVHPAPVGRGRDRVHPHRRATQPEPRGNHRREPGCGDLADQHRHHPRRLRGLGPQHAERC